MTRLRHYDNLETARFVTFCCHHRYPLLDCEQTISVFFRHLETIRAGDNVRLYGYVIMPEHVHLVLHPKKGTALGRVIGRLKARVSREILDQFRQKRDLRLDSLRVMRDNREITAFWQRRCYDHNCRTPATVREKIEYCHKNPVIRGLVDHPGEWRWSSYGFYTGVEDVPLRMDEIA